jgi:hypothetical protein
MTSWHALSYINTFHTTGASNSSGMFWFKFSILKSASMLSCGNLADDYEATFCWMTFTGTICDYRLQGRRLK